jgi:hypothetical protein
MKGGKYMSVKHMTQEHKAAMAAGRAKYFAARRLAKANAVAQPATPVETPVAVAPTKTVTVHKERPYARPIVKTVVRKPYTFASVTVRQNGQTFQGVGFSKWDNKAPEWTEDFGKKVAIGRARKEIERVIGQKIKL